MTIFKAIRATIGRGIAPVMFASAITLTVGNASAEVVKIGVSRVASSGAVYLAVENGYFKEQGLEPQLVFFDAAQPIAVAAASGDIDFGSTALTAGFYTMAGQGVLKIIAAQSHERPGYQSNAFIASNKAYDAGFRSLGDMKGKSVGVNAVGSSTHYSLGLMADKYKVSLDQIRVVPLQTFSNQVSALRGSQVDSIVIPSTIANPLVRNGEAHLLAYVGDETPWQIGALFTATKTAKERPEFIKRFLTAYRKGTNAFHDAFAGADGKSTEGPEAQKIIGVLAKYTNQTPESLKDSIPFMATDGRLDVPDIFHQVEWYKMHKLLAQSIDAKKVIDENFVLPMDAPN
jgi:NitT/TauT family transport system substrate-binding protein